MNLEPWTHRPGVITNADKTAIRGLAEVVPEVLPLFLTSEIAMNRLSTHAFDTLTYANKTVETPLFVLRPGTETIFMDRFESLAVWSVLPHGVINTVAKHEALRFGIKDYAMVSLCFYTGVFMHLDLFDTFVARQAPMHDFARNYLNALSVFRKPGLDSWGVATFFSVYPDISLETGRGTMDEETLSYRDCIMEPYVSVLTGNEIKFLQTL